ncbi:MAG: hypothetical protein KBS52_03840 [Clostridiales bacterium]|nr:hypothetical protein [Candidatus Equinaster intestinalis]
MRRILSLITVLCLVFSVTACKQDSGNSNEKDSHKSENSDVVLSVAYNETDSFDPYAAKTDVNRLLCTLLYDSPVRVNEDFTYENLLAKEIKVSGNVCSITLADASFSDGSPVTSDDVIYSFNAAKKSESRFAAILKSIKSAEKSDGKTVRFILEKNDAYAANLLTFPIIKSGSNTKKDENGIALLPVGSGRYTADLKNEQLIANPNWAFGKVSQKSLRLVNAAGEEALSHVIDIGAIDVYFTNLDDCKIMRMQGNRKNITLNNLVYIGFNAKDPICKQVNFRHAVSSALDRAKICEEAYFTNAVPATGIFHPNWSEVSSIQSILGTSNINIAIENLNQIGYNSNGSAPFAVNSAGEELTVKLLVNKENQFRTGAADMIVKQLALSKIKVIKEVLPFSQYKAKLESGDFQLYLAETEILNNMDVSPLLCPGGSVAYGIPKEKDKNSKTSSSKEETSSEPDESFAKEPFDVTSYEETVSGETTSSTTSSAIEPESEPISSVTLEGVIKGFYAGKNTIADIASMAISEMPVVPVCYRTGILLCSTKISDFSNSCESDIYAFLK